eukprot:7355606-Lingulodinium_polyedra.AAC.1
MAATNAADQHTVRSHVTVRVATTVEGLQTPQQHVLGPQLDAHVEERQHQWPRDDQGSRTSQRYCRDTATVETKPLMTMLFTKST